MIQQRFRNANVNTLLKYTHLINKVNIFFYIKFLKSNVHFI